MSAAQPAAKASGRLGLVVLMVAGLAAMAALRVAAPEPTADMVELAGQAPAKLAPFVDANGAEVKVEAFRGKILILNLWAPWCVPCLKEMPSLDRLAARLPENQFAIAAVTNDAVGDTSSKRMFDKMGLSHLKLYLDPTGELAPEIGARGFPTTLILGPDGAPLARFEGAANWDSDAMVAKLDKLAARPFSAPAPRPPASASD